ncbi:MAG TPA: hypothetical protein VFW48_05150 [Solirubrobacterales bacterium]|nr:hypothetical protein [Solirubrobacterales bacterium]
MSAAAAVLVETKVEARAVEENSVAELRPLPVWCPLPRGEDDPKVTCVGWVAGRQTARAEGVVVTTTWCRVIGDAPQDFVSRPASALRLDRLPGDAGSLWVLSRPRPLDWLAGTLSSARRFRASLDLGAINERRAASFAGARWPGRFSSRPVFGRGWWLPGEEEHRQETTATLGALGDRFVLVDARGGALDGEPLVGEVEEAVYRSWHAERLRAG